MKPPIWFSCGCMTGYDMITGIRPDFSIVSSHGIAFTADLGCIDAPQSMPAGGMRFADTHVGQVQSQTWRGA